MIRLQTAIVQLNSLIQIFLKYKVPINVKGQVD